MFVGYLFLVPLFKYLQETIVQNIILAHKIILFGLQCFMSLLHYFRLGLDGRVLNQALLIETNEPLFTFPDFFFHVFDFPAKINFLQNESVEPVFGYQILLISLIVFL